MSTWKHSVARRVWAVTRSLGVDVRRWPAPGTLERDLHHLLGQSIDTVLDIGANEGQYGQLIRSLRFAGRIISFEPLPTAFERLSTASRNDPDWSCRNEALGEESGSAQMTAYENSQLSSLHGVSEWGEKHWRFGRSVLIDVTVRRLDELITELRVDPKRTLLKIDTQGHDFAVLSGSGGYIDRFAALQLELPVFQLYENSRTLTHALADLSDLGYSPVGFYPVQRHPDDGLSVVEFDGLFVRHPAS